MSYDELINAIEKDAHKERQRVIEGAEIEAKNIIGDAEKELERLRNDKLSELRHSFEQEKIRAISKARRDAKELTLSAKLEIISQVFKETERKIFELRKKKEYADILTRLFREAMERGKMELDVKEFEVYVSGEDINILNDELRGVRLKSNGDIKEGVILVSADNKFRFANTLKSRIERVKADILPLLERILFEGKTKS